MEMPAGFSFTHNGLAYLGVKFYLVYAFIIIMIQYVLIHVVKYRTLNFTLFELSNVGLLSTINSYRNVFTIENQL